MDTNVILLSCLVIVIILYQSIIFFFKKRFETSLFDSFALPIVITDSSGKVIDFNLQARKEFRLKKGEIIFDLFDNEQEGYQSFVSSVYQLMADQHKRRITGVELVSKSDDYYEIFVSKTTHNNKNALVFSLYNINERKEAEKAIYNLAYYDTLTGLPNRLYFNLYVDSLNEETNNNGKFSYAIYLIDLDNFKKINDTKGHAFGDEVLKKFAVLLTKFTEEQITNNESFVARLGGDEFVLIVKNVDEQKAIKVGNQLIDYFKTPVEIEQQQIPIYLTVGISKAPEHGDNFSTLLKSADLALYAAKEKGKRQAMLFVPKMNKRLEEIVLYETALEYFIATEDFDIYFQPIVNLHTGNIVSFECLFRDTKVFKEQLDIEKLFKLAEQMGYIERFGEIILKKSFENIRKLKSICGEHTTFSVNVSTKQLTDSNFVTFIKQQAEQNNIDPSTVVIEITETALVQNLDKVAKIIQELRGHNFQIAIDDFGTGYASIQYISLFDIDEIKIDKRHTNNLNDKKFLEIVKVVTMFSSTMHIRVIAEGIESQQTKNRLLNIGVKHGQGLLFYSPLSVDQIIKFCSEEQNRNLIV